MIEEKEVLLMRLAMCIDTDGHIGISKDNRDNRHAYRPRFGVTNTDIRLIEWLVENFGGSMPPAKYTGETHKDIYKWTLSGFNACKIVKKIRPYLIIKQEQADCVTELHENVTKLNYCKSNPLPIYKKKLQEELFQRCKELNKRGKNEEEETEPLRLIRKTITTLEEYV